MKWTRLAMGTGLTRATSAPGLGLPGPSAPGLDSEAPICTGTGFPPATSATGSGSRQQPPTSASGLRVRVPCRRPGAQVQPEGRAAAATGIHRCGPRGRASGMDARVDLARQPEIHDVRAAGSGCPIAVRVLRMAIEVPTIATTVPITAITVPSAAVWKQKQPASAHQHASRCGL